MTLFYLAYLPENKEKIWTYLTKISPRCRMKCLESDTEKRANIKKFLTTERKSLFQNKSVEYMNFLEKVCEKFPSEDITIEIIHRGEEYESLRKTLLTMENCFRKDLVAKIFSF